MSDKLTEIMAWKRQEIDHLLRPVPLAELAALHTNLIPPQNPFLIPP